MKILLIRNNLSQDTSVSVNTFLDWVWRKTPLQPTLEVSHLHVPLSYKPFGVVVQGQERWGLDGIKAQLRQTGRIAPNTYHVIIFLYQPDASYPLGAWTYPNDLQGAAFIEIPCSPEITPHLLYRYLTHEFLHACHRLCWWKNTLTRDTMDSFPLDDNESPAGNHAKNLAEFEGRWGVIDGPTGPSLRASIEQGLQRAWQLLTKLLDMQPSPIERVAQAIKVFEGWKPGSRSYRNNNPGNLKYIGQKGTIGKDDKGFAIFDSYQSGWKALIHQITIVANGTSKGYLGPARKLGLKDSSEMTLLQFFSVYAPAHDDNDPNAYCLFVCNKAGLDPKTKVKTLL